MYKFMCDDTIFYISGINKEEYYVLSAKLSLEKGKNGAFVFSIPHTNKIFDKIQKLKSIITVYDDGEEIFRGRVLYDEKNFSSIKTVTCEGELAFLLDSIQRPYEHKGSLHDYFNLLIDNHNAQVEAKKRFKVGNITVEDNNDYLSRVSSKYLNTYDSIFEKLTDTYGGYLVTYGKDGERYIDYVVDYGDTITQTIEFGVNLLDIKEFITAEDVFTCLIPLGAELDNETGERLTIKSVNDGVDYLENDTAIELFGRIWKTYTWDDVTIASNLKKKAQEYLDSNIEMSVTLTLKAVDLHLLNVNTDRIKTGDKLRVISLPHNIDKYFECTKLEIDPLNPSNSEYTFGASYKTLTDPSTGLDDKVVEYVDEVVTKVEESTKEEIAHVKDSLTQEEIMNIITNNGEVEGVYLVDGQIWINGTYIDVDTVRLEGLVTKNGLFKIKDDGSIEAVNGKFSGDIESSSFTTVKTQEYQYTTADIEIMSELYLSDATPTAEQMARYDLNQNGKIDSNDALFIQKLLSGVYGNTNGRAVIEDVIQINKGDNGMIVLERRLNGTMITRTEYNSGSINKVGGSITIDGEEVVTALGGTTARFG